MSGAFRRGRRALACALLLASITAGPASAAPGDVDTTFGDMGFLTEVRPVTNAAPIAPRPGGRFVVAWSGQTTVGVSGYLGTGQPDADYGSGGSSSIEVPNADLVQTVHAITDPSGRVLVVGYVELPTTVRMFVARFTDGGDPDPSFSSDGLKVVGFSRGEAYAYGVVARGGRVVVVGQVYRDVGGSLVAAVGLDAGGALDPAFGRGGRRVYDIVGDVGDDWAIDVHPATKGRSLLAGAAGSAQGSDTLLMRIRADGRPDRTFSGDGVIVVDVRKNGADYATDLARSGKRLVFGIGGDTTKPKILRLRADGSRDTSFGTNGVGRYPMSYFNAQRIGVDAERRIYFSAYNADLPVLRVEPDGTISDFGTAGVATNEDPNGWGSAMLVRGGSVLVSGDVSQDAIVVTRYLQA